MAKRPPSPPSKLDALKLRADDFARREPTTAIASAFGAGFLLHLLPLGALAAAIVGLAFACVRPVLLLLGVLKAGEFFRDQTRTAPSHE